MSSSTGSIAFTPQTAIASADNAQPTSTSHLERVSRADGLAGMLGLYKVDGQSGLQYMTEQDLANGKYLSHAEEPGIQESRDYAICEAQSAAELPPPTSDAMTRGRDQVTSQSPADSMGDRQGSQTAAMVELAPQKKPSSGWEFCNPWSDSDCGLGSTVEVVGDQVADVGRGVLLAGKEAAIGVKDLGVGAYRVSLFGMLVDREQWEKSNQNLDRTVSAVVDNPRVVWDAIKEPYVKAWEEGRPGEAIGRGLFEVFGILAGTKGVDKLAGVSKLGGAVSKLDDVATAARRVEEIVQKVEDIARVGNNLDVIPRSATAKAADLMAHGAEGTFYKVKGGVHVKPTPTEEALYLKSVAERAEYSVSKFADGRQTPPVKGDRISCPIEGGPEVISTLHTHPTSKVALPSGGDIHAFSRAGNYSPDALHQIIGDKWPQTRSTLTSMGLEPPPHAPIKWQATTEQVSTSAEKVLVPRPSGTK